MTASVSPDGAYHVFVMAVDELEWTKHWLGTLRCDQILVSVATKDSIAPKIKIRAIESKASSSIQPIEPAPTNEPFAKGKDQVTATLDALWDVLAPPMTSLLADLRFSSFVEHLAAVALSNLYPIRVSDEETVYSMRLISDLSLRKLSPSDQPEEFHIDGAVVCTHFRSAVTRKVVWHTIPGRNKNWDVALARVGTDDLDTVLGQQLSQMAKITEPETPAAAPPTAPTAVPSTEAQVVPVPGASPPATQEEAELAQDLYLACRQRGFPLEEPDPADIIVGPAVVSIPMSLRAGASIRPIESALADLAREVGVTSVVVENDPDRPFHVRFLVARRHREFVSIPETPAPLLDVDAQSYLGMYFGRTLQGRDFVTFVSSWTHMLVGGTTGSGKTTFIRSLLRQLPRVASDLVKVIVVDGKGEIDYLNLVPAEYFAPRFPEVILGHTGVQGVFDWIVQTEMPRRRKVLIDRAKQAGTAVARSARDLFVSSAQSGRADPFPPLIVVVDEFAEIMAAGGSSATAFEQRVQQVTQVGRSVLVHLLLATQRPDVSVLRGAIKANLDARVALRLPTHHDSMTVLGTKGAEDLLGQGDLLFQAAGQPPVRLQGYNA